LIIAQISDLHLRPEGMLYADLVPSNAMAVRAVDHLNGLRPRPDLVMVTGDIADKGAADEYRLGRRILDRIEIPWIVIPGNHDERQAFRRAFADHSYLPAGDGPLNYGFDAHPMRIVALDSTVPGKHHGAIDARSLAWLDQTLAQDGERPTLVIMHHHPFVSGIPYLDEYRHFGASEIEPVIRAHANVERVLCGHVHRLMSVRFANTIAMSCPSTASQIALRLEKNSPPASFMEPPSCLIHLWRPGIGLVSHVSPIGDHGVAMPFF
jgi:3',5'-cyclic AMP phosphodiesterase CpdA